jgi:hypothetical protein
MGWLWDRLKEETTWAGIISVIAAAGIMLSPEQSEAIIALGMALVGAVLAWRKDKGT